jgi:hypothetical protein
MLKLAAEVVRMRTEKQSKTRNEKQSRIIDRVPVLCLKKLPIHPQQSSRVDVSEEVVHP